MPLQVNFRRWADNEFRFEDQMRIDIDTMTEAELIDLNNRIVARLRLLAETRANSKMLEFRIGDRVTFQPDDRPQVVGILTRYNRKSVTVITESGERWNVSPSLLRRVDPAALSDASVIPIRRVSSLPPNER